MAKKGVKVNELISEIERSYVWLIIFVKGSDGMDLLIFLLCACCS